MKDALRLQFEGFQKTEALWEGKLEGIDQFVPLVSQEPFCARIDKKIRLGHLAEVFYRQAIDTHESFRCVEQNLQFFNDQRTIGELDFLIREEETIHHVELAYKFYLLDSSGSGAFLEQWVGPNLKDTLVNKLEKIQSSQFPLIRKPYVSQVLNALGYDVDQIQQSVCFRGQLFVPYGEFQDSGMLNQSCVVGWYLNFEFLHTFKDYLFYIPSKLNWLVMPHFDVEWIPLNRARKEIGEMVDREWSPMVWVRSSEGIQKGFVVWW